MLGLVIASLLSCMTFLMMYPQDIQPEIIFQMAPHTVDMIGVVLRIVVFHQEKGTLKPIIVRFSGFFATRPSKMNIV